MPKRTLQGVVVSDKQDKTIVVRVERRFTHPVLKKTIRLSKKYHAHDENNQYSVGDVVWIQEHRPISKLKRWLVVRGEKRAKTEGPIEVESERRAKKAKGGATPEAGAEAAAS
jgi:small subunit ribosomal protein S17